MEKPSAGVALNLAAKAMHADTQYAPLDFYNTLIPVESGRKVEESEQAKVDEMRAYLKFHFDTDKV